jgi:hypothetical protein
MNVPVITGNPEKSGAFPQSDTAFSRALPCRRGDGAQDFLFSTCGRSSSLYRVFSVQLRRPHDGNGVNQVQVGGVLASRSEDEAAARRQNAYLLARHLHDAPRWLHVQGVGG